MIRNKKLTFKESMVWEKPIEDLVKKYMKGKVCNVCCGLSKLGNERVDINSDVKPTLLADMNNLPIEDNKFDVVISDPPWKINYFHRMKPFFECVRICKVGGRIIYNATWLPESKVVELEKVFVRQSARFGNVSIISILNEILDFAPKVVYHDEV